MNSNRIVFLILTFIGLSIMSCKNESQERKDSYRLLDADVPGLEAEIFAENIISKDNRFEQYCSFSPDGKEFYFSYTDSIWGKSTILKVNTANPSKEDKIILTDSDYQSGQFIDLSGDRLFFTSILFSGGLWHSDIYVAKRTGETWGKSIQLNDPVNSYICEWHPTLTDKGVMYFASERNYDHGIADIYRAVSEKGNYNNVEKLPATVNSEFNETDPLIAPDESFLIFSSNRPNGVSGSDMNNRPNGYDELDLYISFKKGKTNWTEPKNMGKAVNTDSWEFAPALSPDRKYLFFTRREAFNTLIPSKIYWIDSKIIDELRR
jgi:Tol biopolymer transport system component